MNKVALNIPLEDVQAGARLNAYVPLNKAMKKPLIVETLLKQVEDVEKEDEVSSDVSTYVV